MSSIQMMDTIDSPTRPDPNRQLSSIYLPALWGDWRRTGLDMAANGTAETHFNQTGHSRLQADAMSISKK